MIAVGIILSTCTTAMAIVPVNHTITGRVFNDENEGVDACVVALYQSDGVGWARINYVQPLGGNYSFGDVPEGVYRIGVEQLASPPSPVWEYNLPIYMNGSATVAGSVDFTLDGDKVFPWKLDRNPAITGRVTASADGSPISETYVDLYWWDDGFSLPAWDGVRTNPTGDYRIYVPARGSFILGFRKSGWASEYSGDVYRFQDAERRGAGPWVLDAVLDPGVSFQVERAYSPFGNQLPASWTDSANGLPYQVWVDRRVTPEGVEPAAWDVGWWILNAGAHSSWPDWFPPGAYRVRFVPPAGTYLPLWHSGQADQADAQIVNALPGQTINVWARFGGYVRARTTVRSSAGSVRKGRKAKITVTVRDVSLTGAPTAPVQGARVRLQKSFNKRSWTTVTTLTTGSTGTASKTLAITRTTYFRAAPITGATLQGSASSAVKVGVR
jgi:hypothetical protein